MTGDEHDASRTTELPDRAVPGRETVDARQLRLVNEIARIATLDLNLEPMLQRITDAMSAAFGWEFVACVTIDEERRRFVCRALTSHVESEIHVGYRRELGSGVVGEVAATGRPILLDDVTTSANYVETMPGAQSEICLPIVHRDRVIAVLNLESRRRAAFHDELPLLSAIADQVAGAIASARQFTELERRASLLEMSGEVVRIALEAGDLNSVLDRIVQYVHPRFPLLNTAIVLSSEDGRHGILAAKAGQLTEPVGYRFPVTIGIVGRALRTGEEQIVLDVAADPDYVALGEGGRAEMVVPIRFRGDALGVFDFESTTPETFSPENQHVFRALANQVAGTIHMTSVNQRLVETTERLAAANLELERMTMTDPLTHVANRRKFDQVLDAEWRRARRAGTTLGCLMIDIDHFKAFNDRYGHPAGDRCLQSVAAALRQGLRRSADLLARLGGEEFAVLLVETDEPHALDHAETLRQAVEALGIAHAGSPFGSVTVSLGVAIARPPDGGIAGELPEAADRALYEAKRAGRNRVAR